MWTCHWYFVFIFAVAPFLPIQRHGRRHSPRSPSHYRVCPLRWPPAPSQPVTSPPSPVTEAAASRTTLRRPTPAIKPPTGSPQPRKTAAATPSLRPLPPHRRCRRRRRHRPRNANANRRPSGSTPPSPTFPWRLQPPRTLHAPRPTPPGPSGVHWWARRRPRPRRTRWWVRLWCRAVPCRCRRQVRCLRPRRISTSSNNSSSRALYGTNVHRGTLQWHSNFVLRGFEAIPQLFHSSMLLISNFCFFFLNSDFSKSKFFHFRSFNIFVEFLDFWNFLGLFFISWSSIDILYYFSLLHFFFSFSIQIFFISVSFHVFPYLFPYLRIFLRISVSFHVSPYFRISVSISVSPYLFPYLKNDRYMYDGPLTPLPSSGYASSVENQFGCWPPPSGGLQFAFLCFLPGELPCFFSSIPSFFEELMKISSFFLSFPLGHRNPAEIHNGRWESSGLRLAVGGVVAAR